MKSDRSKTKVELIRELQSLRKHISTQDITTRKQVEEETRQVMEDLILINTLNNKVNRGDNLQDILHLIARETKRIFSCHGATVYLLSEDREYLIMQILVMSPAIVSRIEKLIGMRVPALRIPVKTGSLYWKALQNGNPQLINDPKIIQGFMAEFTENKTLKKLVPMIYSILSTHSMITVPLLSEGEAIGLIDVSRKEPFTEFDLQRFESIAWQLTSIIKRKQLEEALQGSIRLKNLLLDVLTHDLKNPAGSINVLANIVSEDQPENEMLAIIKDSSDALLRVLANATELAQVVLGDKIELVKMDITEILQKVTKEFSSQLKQTEMTLNIDVPDKLIVKANQIISEVFSNFISNAIKYASDGKTILIDSEEGNDFLTINVKDFGKAIPENEYNGIFDRGVQLENTKKRGRGLGLAIVKQIAEAHGAEVGVKPNKPAGNIFYIRIPAA